MSYNNSYYLHFVTDLKRVVFCVNSNDLVGAKSFFDHAHKIYEEKLKLIMNRESKELRIDELWLDVYSHTFPTTEIDQKKLSEKLLTLSSMIFLRTTQHMDMLPHNSKLGQTGI